MDAAFRLQDVRRDFSHFSLQDITLSLPRGQIMGFIGLNGAGKSTTIHILMGLMDRDSGLVEVLGRPIPEDRIPALQRVGFVSEDTALYGAATVAWHIDFVRSFYLQWDDHYASELVSRFGLVLGQKVKQLSHGQRLKLALLLSLGRHPELLILDEPTSGLDPLARQRVLSELLDVIQEEARAVLFSTHHTPDVEQIADQVTLIHEGRLLDSDDTVAFLDRWRRIRIDVNPDHDLPLPSHCTWTSQQGRHRVLTSSEFSTDLPRWLASRGAAVLEVQRLSLEEAFACQVAQAEETNQS